MCPTTQMLAYCSEETTYEENQGEAAEHAKLLAKWRKAKEKHQEQIAKRHRLPSLRTFISKSDSSQKWDFLKVINK